MSPWKKDDHGRFSGIVSALRWFWFYTLPMKLAAPFQSKIFLTAYITLMAILGLVFLTPQPKLWGEFLRNLLYDQWTRIAGEKSADQGIKWITSFSSDLILTALLILFGIGMFAILWAEPRRRFFSQVEKIALLKLVPVAGMRIDFLNKIYPMTGLARGPTGKIQPYYFPFREYPGLLEKARQLRTDRANKGLLICGPPNAGKTRTALELIFDLNPPFVVVWPRELMVNEAPVLPEYKGFFVILADDLSLGASPQKSELPAYLDYLIQRCPQAVLIATSRQSLLPEDIRTLIIVPLETTEIEDWVPLAHRIALEESSSGRQVPVKEVLDRFNGYPGSLVAGVQAMQAEYARLDQEAQAFLQVIPVLWDLGIRRLTIQRLWESCQDLFGRLADAIQQEFMLKQLEKKGFFTLVKEPIARISMPDSYREQVIPPLISIEKPDQRLLNGFMNRQDWDAFLEIGNSWSEEYSEAYQLNPAPLCTGRSMPTSRRCVSAPPSAPRCNMQPPRTTWGPPTAIWRGTSSRWRTCGWRWPPTSRRWSITPPSAPRWTTP